MNNGVAYMYQRQRPPLLENLGACKLGADPAGNFIRLRALTEALQPLPDFICPRSWDNHALMRVVLNHETAFNNLTRAQAQVANAALELRILRPKVERMWETFALHRWIRTHVRRHEDQLAWGLSPTDARAKFANVRGPVGPA